ncbi:MAG: hypothetical protein Q8K36_02975, partial [Alphaproteobacteria bacterium]|nr:hypothetical protein [Alphaproteobacteria bacterium]
GTFSKDPKRGTSITTYFEQIGRAHDGLYECAISAKTNIEDSKAIIIDHYGGFAGIEFHLPAVVSSKEKYLLDQNYAYINLRTRDNWQTVPQWDQFKTLAGKQLLGDTLIQFFLFVNELKTQYPHKPFIYKGGSFGGTMGVLINLILSNKDNVSSLFSHEFQDLANRLTEFFHNHPNISTDLIDGYILHDGGYRYLWQNEHVIKQFKVRNPMLLLQNFDDERVTLEETLSLYDRLIEGGTDEKLLSVHITPQGAPTSFQTTDFEQGAESTSIEGHFMPTLPKYRNEYTHKVIEFLNHMTSQYSTFNASYRKKMNALRIRHAKDLRCNECNDFSNLYRLYYANFHHDQKARMNDLLSKTLAQYSAYRERILAENYTAEEQYIFMKRYFGLLLVGKILTKNQQTGKAVMELIRNNKNDIRTLRTEGNVQALQQESETDQPEGLKVSNETRSFILTEEAREFLHKHAESMDLLKRAKDYSYVITPEVLDFINQNKAQPYTL